MKKVILSAAALLIGTFAFAQVSGAPEAEAPTSPVAALPGAPITANTGTSIQNGDNQKVQVRQAGTSQSVYTHQDNGSGIGGNLARIMQTGEVQDGISGTLNWSETYQSGSANQATTFQEGDSNNGFIAQGRGGDAGDDASSGNRARIQQGVAEQGEFNFSAIEQNGVDNKAKSRQTYDNNDSWINQDGELNKAFVNQDGGPNETAGHEAKVNQVGNSNWAKVQQDSKTDDGIRNFAEIDQLGNGNMAQQMQTSDGGAANAGNHALIDQGAGSGLEDDLGTGIVTGATGDDIDLDDADPVLDPGSFSGSSYNGMAFQNQEGRRNKAYIEQFGADNGKSNYAWQDQDGRRNDAYISQNAYGSATAGGNNAYQEQDGKDNRAGIMQTGTGNLVSQKQDGDDNQAMSTQKYSNNYAFVNQYDDDNRALTAQMGVGNKILLTQYGGQSYTANQNMNGTDKGAFGTNQIDVLQMGPDDSYLQDDCVIPLTQEKMDFGVGSFSLKDICADCPE